MKNARIRGKRRSIDSSSLRSAWITTPSNRNPQVANTLPLFKEGRCETIAPFATKGTLVPTRSVFQH